MLAVLLEVADGDEKMITSERLNTLILELSSRDDLLYETYGGKTIPYIGWYWRRVNFDSSDYYFGVLPGGELGFMENNKWDYEVCHCSPMDWKMIRRLLETALLNQTHENFKAVDDKIQSLADGA